MKALHNFLISWVLVFCIATAATLRVFIAPFTFIFSLDKYKKSTEDLKARIQELENQIESVKWQPVGGKWFIDDEGIVFQSPSTQGMKEFGHERPTEQQAERAAVEMRRFNRLLALRDELCGDDENWITDNNNYYIYYDYEDETYFISANCSLQTMGAVYFISEKNAQRACEMLNSGEVEL